eukprot:2494139-Prymnesium_polylepis.1
MDRGDNCGPLLHAGAHDPAPRLPWLGATVPGPPSTRASTRVEGQSRGGHRGCSFSTAAHDPAPPPSIHDLK